MPGIIKGDGQNAGAIEHSHIAFNFDDIGKKAEDYLQNIRIKADALLQEARRCAQSTEQEVYQQAHQKALQEFDGAVEERIQQRLAQTLPAIDSAVSELKSQLHQWQEDWEHAVMKLSTGIAEKIIQRELQHRPEIALDQVRSAVLLTSPNQAIELRLNPLDIQTIGSSMNDLLHSLGRIARTKVVADESIGRGGCVVLTEFGVIDNQIRSQLDRIESELSAKQ